MKGIRIIILFMVVMLCGTYADAQGVKVYRTDGTTINISYTVLDSIVNVPAKDFIDLGLSVKWAACNVGAERPEQYGFYFAWGETSPKKNYCEGDSIIKTAPGDISGIREYDAALATWGVPARMPTNDEISELCEKCTWQRVLYNNVFGMLVTGPSGKSIFLPAAGFRIGISSFGEGADGYYWSSTVTGHSEKDAYYLDFDKKFYYWGNWLRRYLGQPVRAVADFSE